MANTDPEALKAAALAYQRSNASLADYDPSTQQVVDRAWAAVRGDEGPRVLPAEPVTVSADAAVAPAPKAESAPVTEAPAKADK